MANKTTRRTSTAQDFIRSEEDALADMMECCIASIKDHLMIEAEKTPEKSCNNSNMDVPVVKRDRTGFVKQFIISNEEDDDDRKLQKRKFKKAFRRLATVPEEFSSPVRIYRN